MTTNILISNFLLTHFFCLFQTLKSLSKKFNIHTSTCLFHLRIAESFNHSFNSLPSSKIVQWLIFPLNVSAHEFTKTWACFCGKHSPILMNLQGNICSSILCFSVNVSLLKSFLRPLGLDENDTEWSHHITRNHFPKHYSRLKRHYRPLYKMFVYLVPYY